MVRFIIYCYMLLLSRLYVIYIPIWLDLLFGFFLLFAFSFFHLHSNMVRFIILLYLLVVFAMQIFTFQYGQIYYYYIRMRLVQSYVDLHSNMVRFIIKWDEFISKVKELIYIPIWLDLLSKVWSTGIAMLDKFTFQYGQIYYFIGIR